MQKFYFARREVRYVTSYYEIDAEDHDAAYDALCDEQGKELGFNIGGMERHSEPQVYLLDEQPQPARYQW